jgi:surface antigen
MAFRAVSDHRGLQEQDEAIRRSKKGVVIMRKVGLRTIALVLLVAILGTGCATMEANPKTTIGAVGGGTLGGLIAAAAGGNPAAIAASVVGGILVGGLVGNLLDERDKRMAAEAAQKALESAPTGQPVAWRNPDNGHSGSVVVVQTYQTASASYCRQFEQKVNIGGQQEKAYGTACRQPDGSWKIVNS